MHRKEDFLLKKSLPLLWLMSPFPVVSSRSQGILRFRSPSRAGKFGNYGFKNSIKIKIGIKFSFIYLPKQVIEQVVEYVLHSTVSARC